MREGGQLRDKAQDCKANFLEHIVNGREQHPCNGDDCLLVAPALFNGKVTAMDFREPFGFNGEKSALNKQRLDVGPG